MEMDAHQAVGMDLPGESSDDLGQQFEKVLAVIVSAIEDRALLHAATADVVQDVGSLETGFACHRLDGSDGVDDPKAARSQVRTLVTTAMAASDTTGV